MVSPKSPISSWHFRHLERSDSSHTAHSSSLHLRHMPALGSSTAPTPSHAMHRPELSQAAQPSSVEWAVHLRDHGWWCGKGGQAGGQASGQVGTWTGRQPRTGSWAGGRAGGQAGHGRDRCTGRRSKFPNGVSFTWDLGCPHILQPCILQRFAGSSNSRALLETEQTCSHYLLARHSRWAMCGQVCM